VRRLLAHPWKPLNDFTKWITEGDFGSKRHIIRTFVLRNQDIEQDSSEETVTNLWHSEPLGVHHGTGWDSALFACHPARLGDAQSLHHWYWTLWYKGNQESRRARMKEYYKGKFGCCRRFSRNSLLKWHERPAHSQSDDACRYVVPVDLQYSTYSLSCIQSPLSRTGLMAFSGTGGRFVGYRNSGNSGDRVYDTGYPGWSSQQTGSDRAIIFIHIISTWPLQGTRWIETGAWYFPSVLESKSTRAWGLCSDIYSVRAATRPREAEAQDAS